MLLVKTYLYVSFLNRLLGKQNNSHFHKVSFILKIYNKIKLNMYYVFYTTSSLFYTQKAAL